jgi:hypothetical protein
MRIIQVLWQNLFISTRTNAIRGFEIAWRIVFGEEFHPNKEAGTGLHECVLACKVDCKYIGRLAELLGKSKSDEAGLRT